MSQDDFVFGVIEGLRRDASELEDLINGEGLTNTLIEVIKTVIDTLLEALKKKRGEIRGYLGYGENAKLEGMEAAYTEMIEMLEGALTRAGKTRGSNGNQRMVSRRNDRES